MTPTPTNPPHPAGSAPTNPSPEVRGISVSVRSLNKAYGSQCVLEDLDLDIHPGEVFVLMGPSGCGKSTFLRHLIGLEEPDAGEIRLNGEPLDDAIQSRYRTAMVFQTGGLLNSLSVAENVGLYLSEHHLLPPDAIRKVVRETLDLVQLDRAAGDKFPTELSGGMRKRAAIARAFTMDPQLVLYDEPTAELDPLVARTIGREIRHLNRRTGTTSVVVTHDCNLALGIADRIGFLNGGRLQALGTPDQVRALPDPLLQRFLFPDFSD